MKAKDDADDDDAGREDKAADSGELESAVVSRRGA